MASITVVCPNCDKKSQSSEENIGKKTRCKGCDTVFRIEPPRKPKSAPSKATATAKPPAAPPPPSAPKPPKSPLDDPDDDGKAYILTETTLGARCPECANEMESEDSIVCLHCGYNTRTRTRVMTKKVYETTGLDIFLWLLPGIASLLALIGLLVFDIIYTTQSEGWFDKDSWTSLFAHQSVIIWMWVLSLGAFFYLGRFSISRLILNNKPPEIEK